MRTIPSMPVIEPLSRATQNTLAPVPFQDTDFLELDVDEKGEVFIAETVYLEKDTGRSLPTGDDDVQYIEVDGEIYIKSSKSYRYPSYNAYKRWWSRIPESKQIGIGKYRLAMTDFTALVIHHVWPISKIIFKSEEARLNFLLLLKRFIVQTKSASIIADFKVNGTVPEMPNDYIRHPDLPLSDYQEVALMASLHSPAFCLFMEQGTGKTPIVVNRINLEGYRKRSGRVGSTPSMYRALILCPQQLRYNWNTEFRRFSTRPGKVVVLRGGQLSRLRDLVDGVKDEKDCCWSATIMSIDSVGSMWDALKKIKWGIVIIDESHSIKNTRTARYKNVVEIDDAHAASKMELTGTPVTNTVFDLFGQFEWLGKGLSGFTTFENFRAFHGRWRKVEGSFSRKLESIANVPLLKERLARMSFIINKKDANLGLPDKVYDYREVTMTADQATIYKDMATKLVVEIESTLASSDNEAMTAEHILTKLLRLAQITSGYVKTDVVRDLTGAITSGGQNIEINPGKNPKVLETINMIREDQANDSNSKALIWCCFKPDIHHLSVALHEAGIKHTGYHKEILPQYRAASPQECEDVINRDDSCRVFIGNPKSGGTGSNYLGYDRENPDVSDMYVDHEIYFSCNWSMVERAQSEDRAHRRGTRSIIRITDLVVPLTIDTEIRERVKGKMSMAQSLQNVMDIMHSILDGYKAA